MNRFEFPVAWPSTITGLDSTGLVSVWWTRPNCHRNAFSV